MHGRHVTKAGRRITSRPEGKASKHTTMAPAARQGVPGRRQAVPNTRWCGSPGRKSSPPQERAGLGHGDHEDPPSDGPGPEDAARGHGRCRGCPLHVRGPTGYVARAAARPFAGEGGVRAIPHTCACGLRGREGLSRTPSAHRRATQTWIAEGCGVTGFTAVEWSAVPWWSWLLQGLGRTASHG